MELGFWCFMVLVAESRSGMMMRGQSMGMAVGFWHLNGTIRDYERPVNGVGRRLLALES